MLIAAPEQRIFKAVEKSFGSTFPANAVRLHHIRDYQRERRKHIIPTMKQPITGGTVNYEMHLLRSVLKFVGCCTAGDALVAKLDPVPQSKRRPS